MSDPDSCVIWLLSDLHLASDPDGPAFERSCALANLLSDLAIRRRDDPDGSHRLVILGDFMDLPNTTFRAARDEVELIAARHAKVFKALFGLVSAGVDIVVVPGNHDIELSDNETFAVLDQHMRAGEATTGRLRLVRWVFYVPGLVYAEHGNQYHDINWFSTLLDPAVRGAGDEVHRTSARWLSELRRTLANRPPRIRSVLEAANGLALSLLRQPPWALSQADYLNVISRFASEIRVDDAAARDLHSITRRGPMRIFVRLAQKLVRTSVRRLQSVLGPQRGRLLGSEETDAYLLRALPHIVEVTRRHDMIVPWYVFGHTHVARCVAMGEGATYLNTGTWTSQLPPSRAADGEAWLTFVEATPHDAKLLRWVDSDRRCEEVSTDRPPARR